MSDIAPSNVLYIKLGRNGMWENECANIENTIKVGYYEANHQDCLVGNWDNVRRQMLALRGDEGAATRDVNQIRYFYAEPESTLWITSFGGRMRWCFARPEVSIWTDGRSKIRRVQGNWSDSDINGRRLDEGRLSGRLKATTSA